MNIKGLSDELVAQRMTRTESVRLGRMKKTLKTGPGSGDQADTSQLSRLMSKGSKELGSMTSVRADRIAAFQSQIDEPTNASIQVTNVIFDHMING